MPQTQPSEARGLPPGWSVTRDAGDVPEGGAALVALGRPGEAAEVGAYFESTGWRVAFAGAELPRGPFDLVYLDGLGAIRLATLLMGRAPWLYLGREARTVALVDEGEEAPAWAAGVEWVVVRPLLPDDPLGLGRFLDSVRQERFGA